MRHSWRTKGPLHKTWFWSERFGKTIGGRALEYPSDALPPRFHFNGFECAQVAADTFGRPVVILEDDTTLSTFIPLSSVQPIVLKYSRRFLYHYDLYLVDESCTFTPIHPLYKKININIRERENVLREAFANFIHIIPYYLINLFRLLRSVKSDHDKENMAHKFVYTWL